MVISNSSMINTQTSKKSKSQASTSKIGSSMRDPIDLTEKSPQIPTLKGLIDLTIDDARKSGSTKSSGIHSSSMRYLSCSELAQIISSYEEWLVDYLSDKHPCDFARVMVKFNSVKLSMLKGTQVPSLSTVESVVDGLIRFTKAMQGYDITPFGAQTVHQLLANYLKVSQT